jgi:hypothetical protein
VTVSAFTRERVAVFIARDTVLGWTRASSATSRIVAGPRRG